MGRIIRKIKSLLIPNKASFSKERDFIESDYLNFQNISFAQEGEDMVLNRFFEEQNIGVYVDIGAHHPIRFSNTYKFYLKGWTGINIDAMPGSMNLFNEIRPNDINLELGISENTEILTYYIFNEPALNTFSEKEAKLKDGFRTFRIIETKRIQTYTLAHILDQYLKENTKIDFMSIDVEGLDLPVLHSNNWEKYRPKILLVESLREDLSLINKNEIYVFLNGLGYKLMAKTYNTMFFKDGEG